MITHELQLPPELAFFAAHTVHDAGDVLEMPLQVTGSSWHTINGHCLQHESSMHLAEAWQWRGGRRTCSCCLRSAASAPFHRRPSWNGMGHAFCSASLLTCTASHIS